MGAMKKMLMEGHELLDNLVAHAKENDLNFEPTGPNWMDELVNYLFVTMDIIRWVWTVRKREAYPRRGYFGKKTLNAFGRI